MTSHQCGISAFFPQKSFCRETSGYQCNKMSAGFSGYRELCSQTFRCWGIACRGEQKGFWKGNSLYCCSLAIFSALLSSLCATKPCGHLEWAKACWKASPQQKHHYPLIRNAHRLLNDLSYTIYGFDDQSEIFILFTLVCMVTKHCVCPCLVTRQMFRSTCLVKHIVYTFLDIFH